MPGAYGKRADMLVHQRDPFNAEPPRAALAGRSLTAVDAFYVRGHGPVPALDASSWRLEVGGRVARELSLDLDELRSGRFAEAELVATLQCAGNRRAGLMAVAAIPGEAPWGPGATGTARWRGVRLRDLLAAAGPAADAAHVAFVGADVSGEADPPQPFGGSVPLGKALAEEVLIAFEMNDAPLPVVHGAPARVVVPGYIGARSVKWLRRIEVRHDPWDGYFQATSYRLLAPGQEPGPGRGMALGEAALNADFLSPEDGASVPAGTVGVQGYAFAGGPRAVSRVDVTADGGRSWVQAELGEDLGPWAWRLWRGELPLAPGDHELVARAWDTAANLQPERPESLWNPKGYVNSAWARIRLHAKL